MHFEDTASAAEAAAESAKQAIAAAQAAAYLANKNFNQTTEASSLDDKLNDSWVMPNHHSPVNSQNMGHQQKAHGRTYASQSFRTTPFGSSEEETPTSNVNGGKVYRRHSYNAPRSRHSYNAPPSEHSDIKFDESDCDEEIEMEEPPSGIHPPPKRPPPPAPSFQDKQDSNLHVHPKLPDYDALAARFEALKYRK